MAEPLRLFVSATNDLEAERAAIGRALARLPVQVSIEIRRTPAAGAPIEEIHERIANVDRVYFLLGADITAPAGAEWFLAWKMERSLLALRRRTLSAPGPHLSPAGQEFVRAAFVPWKSFTGPDEAARIVALDVAAILQHPANRYGLGLVELQQLTAYAARLQRATPAEQPRTETGGAQGGGVLLDMGHREPIQGVPLDEL
jgi:hypothetical protein